MIGKPEWFTPRKFGWGLGIRNVWGYAYVAFAAVLFFAAAELPAPLEQKMVVFGALFVALLADVLHIMSQVYSKLDEREEKHQLVAERNASFAAVAGIVALIMFTAFTAGGENGASLPFALAPMIAVLVLMSFVKGATLIYLEREG